MSVDDSTVLAEEIADGFSCKSKNTILVNEEFSKALNVVCDPAVDAVEGERIAAQLFDELVKSKTGVGLAANQIGITKRVCVVNVLSPIYMINPRIVGTDGEQVFREGCLSFPGVVVTTKRHKYVTVVADNFEGPRVFGGDTIDLQLESVVVQHEISHLDGKTMFDFRYRQEPIKAGRKIGRNDKVTIASAAGTDQMTLKWKKAELMIKTGDWVLLEDTDAGKEVQEEACSS